MKRHWNHTEMKINQKRNENSSTTKKYRRILASLSKPLMSSETPLCCVAFTSFMESMACSINSPKIEVTHTEKPSKVASIERNSHILHLLSPVIFHHLWM